MNKITPSCPSTMVQRAAPVGCRVELRCPPASRTPVRVRVLDRPGRGRGPQQGRSLFTNRGHG
eukprot:scaffold92253_cov45-Prasinocladus_malaysianus.AAC.1